MPTIHRLESPTCDFQQGGVLITFDSGRQKVISWRHSTHVDVRETAKKCVAQLMEEMAKDPINESDIRNTNWVSMVAGVAKHLVDWNDALVASVNQAHAAAALEAAPRDPRRPMIQ